MEVKGEGKIITRSMTEGGTIFNKFLKMFVVSRIYTLGTPCLLGGHKGPREIVSSKNPKFDKKKTTNLSDIIQKV